MEHDAQCGQQDRDLTLLKEQFRTMNETMHEVVVRLQDLVLQYHGQNVAQATVASDLTHIKGKVDQIEASLGKDFALRSEFVEIKGEWRMFLKIVLGAILATLLSGLGWAVKGGIK